MEILTGHVSQETAHVVNDYPYGFRLRCKIRYWLEYKQQHGYRLMSQTTNPKISDNYWNKPKGSTYSRLAAVLVKEDNDHIGWRALDGYGSLEESEQFLATYGTGMTDLAQKILTAWISVKREYDEQRKRREQTVTASQQ